MRHLGKYVLSSVAIKKNKRIKLKQKERDALSNIDGENK